MNIPDEFELGGVTWRVEHTDALSEMGHCDCEQAVIRIRKNLGKEVREATFCHELQHAIRFTAGETDHDERQVDAHGNLLHQFLKTQR